MQILRIANMQIKYEHVPVMLKEAIKYLRPKVGDIIVDCTLGGGGYTMALADKVGSKGKVIAIDIDDLAVQNAIIKFKNKKNIKIEHDNFSNLQKIIKKNRYTRISGIVFDLGLSSAQLQDRSRGFSFKLDAPLDMNFGIQNSEFRIIRTKDIINTWSEEKLIKIIKEYGDERYARRIAGAIVKARGSAPGGIKTAKQLAEIILMAVPKNYEHGRINPATRTFQALRIATNNELENLQKTLPQALDLLRQGGRLVVVSYHSLEDRIVKNFFRQEAKGCICPPEMPVCQCEHKPRVKIITKKVVVPSAQEVEKNPRARSAKLRCAERI